MSLYSNINIECPHCNAPQEGKCYSSVNVTVDPSLKETILKGNLNSQLCTSCHKEINIMSGFLYHDMQKRILINLRVNPDSEPITNSEPFKQFMEKKYIFREVFSYPELVEKIILFDQNINDKVIENIANQIKETFNEVIKDNTLNVFFVKIEKSIFKKKIVFECFTHPSQIMHIKWNFKQLTAADRTNLFNIDILRT